MTLPLPFAVKPGKPGCPSLPVELYAIPSSQGTGLEPVSIDLVPSLHVAGLPPGAEKNLSEISIEDARFIRKAGFDVIPKEYRKG